MYQLTKEVNGTTIQVELGVVNDKNPEHVANVHVYIHNVGHIRGITAYRKQRNNGGTEILLRMPGYLKTPESKQKTSYLALDQEVNNAIIEAIETVTERVKFYCHDQWTIWATKKEVTPRHEEILDQPYTEDEDPGPIGDDDIWFTDPEEGAR